MIHEKFPKNITLLFVPTDSGCSLYTGLEEFPPLQLSNHTTDIIRGDGYRWYYALSFSYLAHFGWSPIIRDRFGIKRRSIRQIEKGEDGARAQMIEEFISLISFKSTDGFTHPISKDIISEIFDSVRFLESSKIDKSSWKDALKTGGELFNFLRSRNGGVIKIDTEKKNIRWDALPEKMQKARIDETPETRNFKHLVRARGVYNVVLVETKPETVEIFANLSDGGLINLGSKAEEWSFDPSDGFRWHDIFHIAIFTVTGWSAVCKTMFGLSDEDAPRSGMMGIRGALLEEIFISRYFMLLKSGVHHSDAAEHVGRLAEILTKKTKLDQIKPRDWSQALKLGYEIYTLAKTQGGGRLQIDLEKKQLRLH